MNKINNPSYFFVKTQTKWCFIAENAEYKTNAIPLEKWVSGDASYTLCRVCYTKEKAADLCKRSMESQIGMMEGPDLYIVVDEKCETVVTIWKPKLDVLEISLALKGNIKNQLVSDSITFENLKQNMQELMGLTNPLVTIISNEYSHIVTLPSNSNLKSNLK